MPPSLLQRIRPVLAGLAALAFLLLSRDAAAYPWMIRHEYTGCVQCHVDPDGAGLLTEYGRAQGETLLRTHYSRGAADEEPGRVKDFLWGLFKTPDWLLLGGSFRPGVQFLDIAGTTTPASLILMQADARAGIKVGGWRASVSAGVISTDDSLASVAGPFVAREYWGGYTWGDEEFMVRAGRMNLPFGIRQIEHPLWVRAETRTDINDGQEHGVSFDYMGEKVRGSLMAIAGNYQISPDAYRERGYAGFVEVDLNPRFVFGASSLITYAGRDIFLDVPDVRQAHGLFARATPAKPLVLLAEADLIADTTRPTSAASSLGAATMLQADVEPLQGLHLIVTGETLSPGGRAPDSSFGVWGSVDWFFLPHADVRFDLTFRDMANGTAGIGAAATYLPTESYLIQLHVYL